jgi:hypothetical protein
VTWNGHRPVRCQLCGEWFPDNDAAWEHDCPVIEANVEEFHRRVRPTLPQYRTIAHQWDRWPLSDWRRRLIRWGTRAACGPDATLVDGIARALRPRAGDRVAGRLKRGRERAVRDRQTREEIVQAVRDALARGHQH